jgi:GT2 family glycosyltransferase
MTLSFLLVTYNNQETIEACLASIVRFTSASFEIVVADNSPNGETLAAVRRFISAHPNTAVQVLYAQGNIGFSRACNLAARSACGEYLFFLNPDTQLLNDAAPMLAACLQKNPRALAAGPALFDSAGNLTRTCRNLPTLSRIILDATGLDSWLGAYKLTRFPHDHPRPVEQIMGAAMLLRRSDYERLGGLDERFFIYFEEVDLCKRLRELGGEIWFWPEARVQHLAGRSCEAEAVRARMIFTLRASRKKYFRKHFGVFGGAAIELVNRLEGIEKSVVLAALWLLRRKPGDREKACGFWAVATGIAP